MDIGALRSRITIQENGTDVDEIGNRMPVWTDSFSCWATVSGTSGDAQSEDAGLTADHAELSFTVRYCTETASVSIKTHRILFGGEAYDIVAADLMNMGKKCLKFRCRKTRV